MSDRLRARDAVLPAIAVTAVCLMLETSLGQQLNNALFTFFVIPAAILLKASLIAIVVIVAIAVCMPNDKRGVGAVLVGASKAVFVFLIAWPVVSLGLAVAVLLLVIVPFGLLGPAGLFAFGALIGYLAARDHF